jgi:very-short-patch-repair endonuclease
MIGGVVSRGALLDAGATRAAIHVAVRSGRLRPIRRGWYAIDGADPKVVRAVSAGGSLGCASALQFHGVWMREVRGVHIAFAHGSHGDPTGVVAHWVRTRRVHGVVDVLEAFRQFAACGTPVDVVIAADSALNRGLLTHAEVAAVLGRTTRGRRLLSRIDARAESGIETLVRLMLRSHHVKLVSQVEIEGVGRVDFVVGESLAVEVDGWEWHADRFEQDRARDAALVALGYTVIRFSYRRVMYDLSGVERQLMHLVRRGVHLKRRLWTQTHA